jgi:hypothetical protein
MSAGGKSRRRAVAFLAAVLATGIAACGGEQPRDQPSAAATASPAAAATATPKPAAPSPQLTAQERRRARKQLKRLRKETQRTPPNVVSDSGVIP